MKKIFKVMYASNFLRIKKSKYFLLCISREIYNNWFDILVNCIHNCRDTRKKKQGRTKIYKYIFRDAHVFEKYSLS